MRKLRYIVSIFFAYKCVVLRILVFKIFRCGGRMYDVLYSHADGRTDQREAPRTDGRARIVGATQTDTDRGPFWTLFECVWLLCLNGLEYGGKSQYKNTCSLLLCCNC